MDKQQSVKLANRQKVTITQKGHDFLEGRTESNAVTDAGRDYVQAVENGLSFLEELRQLQQNGKQRK